jgi:hypothetical protein
MNGASSEPSSALYPIINGTEAWVWSLKAVIGVHGRITSSTTGKKARAELRMHPVHLVEHLRSGGAQAAELIAGATDRELGELRTDLLGGRGVERSSPQMQPASAVTRALRDGEVEQAARPRRGHQVEHRLAPGGLTEDGDTSGITPERSDVVADPFEDGDLIEEAVVARHVVG